MSSHSEPYANGFGILAGILILWIGTLAIVFATGFIGLIRDWSSNDGEEEDSGDEESRVGSQGADVASAKTRATYRSITLSHAISPSDLPGFTRT